MHTKVEPYLTPKGISAALERDYGLQITPDYIRAIRQECNRRGILAFIASFGRASFVFEFLKANPKFRRRMARQQSQVN